MTAADLTTAACGTGKTGGWLLQAPAAFFRHLKGHDTPRATRCEPIRQHILATQVWLVTWQHQNGGVQTNAVMISGVWRMADIETQARDALHRQHDITGAQILRLTLDFNMTPARLEALQRITDQYQSRMQFEEECG